MTTTPIQPPRRRWITPAVADLPRLADLTLQTGLALDGTSGGFSY